MATNQSTNFFLSILRSLPLIVLFFSVLNEADINYLNINYFSINFPFILIFYWSLKRPENLGYGLVFLVGIINDIVVGLPIGLSSIDYLLVCGFAAYLSNMTLRPHIVNDWIFFLLTLAIVNSSHYSILSIFFSIHLNYIDLIFNTVFTFIFYMPLAAIFRFYLLLVFGGERND